jgi:hypothetical protein
MPTINSIRSNTGNSKTVVVSWLNMANGDDGQPFEFCQYADRSIQVVGTFGAGGIVRIEGSNNGTDWAVLTDAQGNDLNFSSAKIEQVIEATFLIRPRVVAGDGSTSLSVILAARE